MAIMLTERAAQEVKKIRDEQKVAENLVLRVAAKGGGCSGYEYGLWFDEANPEQDELVEYHGVKVAVDRKSNLYLSGTEVDFYEDVTRRGFAFKNPNATKTCGCGTSFQV